MKYEPNATVSRILPRGEFEGILESIAPLTSKETKSVNKETGEQVITKEWLPVTKAGQEMNAVRIKLVDYDPIVIREYSETPAIFESQLKRLVEYFDVKTLGDLFALKAVPVKGYKEAFSKVYTGNGDRKVFNGYNYFFGTYTPTKAVVDLNTGEIEEA